MATRGRRSTQDGSINPAMVQLLDISRLRKELGVRGLDTKGNKTVLADRLEEALSLEKGGGNNGNVVADKFPVKSKRKSNNNADSVKIEVQIEKVKIIEADIKPEISTPVSKLPRGRKRKIPENERKETEVETTQPIAENLNEKKRRSRRKAKETIELEVEITNEEKKTDCDSENSTTQHESSILKREEVVENSVKKKTQKEDEKIDDTESSTVDKDPLPIIVASSSLLPDKSEKCKDDSSKASEDASSIKTKRSGAVSAKKASTVDAVKKTAEAAHLKRASLSGGDELIPVAPVKKISTSVGEAATKKSILAPLTLKINTSTLASLKSPLPEQSNNTTMPLQKSMPSPLLPQKSPVLPAVFKPKQIPQRVAPASIDLLDIIFDKQDMLLADKYKSEQDKALEKQNFELEKRKNQPALFIGLGPLERKTHQSKEKKSSISPSTSSIVDEQQSSCMNLERSTINLAEVPPPPPPLPPPPPPGPPPSKSKAKMVGNLDAESEPSEPSILAEIPTQVFTSSDVDLADVPPPPPSPPPPPPPPPPLFCLPPNKMPESNVETETSTFDEPEKFENLKVVENGEVFAKEHEIVNDIKMEQSTNSPDAISNSRQEATSTEEKSTSLEKCVKLQIHSPNVEETEITTMDVDEADNESQDSSESQNDDEEEDTTSSSDTSEDLDAAPNDTTMTTTADMTIDSFKLNPEMSKALIQRANEFLDEINKKETQNDRQGVEYAQLDCDEVYALEEEKAPPDFYGQPVPDDEDDDDALFEMAAGIRKKRDSVPLVIEEEPPPDNDFFELDYYNADMNIKSAVNNKWLIEPDNSDGFALMWGGVRSNYGIRISDAGENQHKYVFQIKIVEFLSLKHVPFEELEPHDVRIGWSTSETLNMIGEHSHSYAFCSLARKAHNNVFIDYGDPFHVGDVVTTIFDLENKEIKYYKNDTSMGVAYSDINLNEGDIVFPHIATKNCKVLVNFGVDFPDTAENADQWRVPQAEQNASLKFVGELKSRGHCLIPSRRPPPDKTHCTVIVMVGLPGAGKTTWIRQYLRDHPEEHWVLLNTDTVLNAMTVNGVPRRRVHQGRWDMIMGLAAKALNKSLSMACRRRHNYMLDQTNVSRDARKRKLTQFVDFQRKCVVIIPSDDELDRRLIKQSRHEGSAGQIPPEAMLELKAMFSIPCTETEPVEDVLFVEPPISRINEAIELVKKYNEEAKPWLRKIYKTSKPEGVISDNSNLSNQWMPGGGQRCV